MRQKYIISTRKKSESERYSLSKVVRVCCVEENEDDERGGRAARTAAAVKVE